MVIGAQKCGTTAIHEYLAKHPQLVAPSIKEIHFFDLDPSYERGVGWYHTHFPLPHQRGSAGVTYDTTPSYLYYPKSAERIYAYDAEQRFVVLLRDPVQRAFSAWNMYRQFREKDHPFRNLAEVRDFDRAIRDEIQGIRHGPLPAEPSYVRRGFYHGQILRFLKWFGRERLLILDSVDLERDPAAALARVTRFLDLPEHAWSEEQFPKVHARPYEESISSEALATLRDLYAPHNDALYELLGRDHGW